MPDSPACHEKAQHVPRVGPFVRYACLVAHGIGHADRTGPNPIGTHAVKSAGVGIGQASRCVFGRIVTT